VPGGAKNNIITIIVNTKIGELSFSLDGIMNQQKVFNSQILKEREFYAAVSLYNVGDIVELINTSYFPRIHSA